MGGEMLTRLVDAGYEVKAFNRTREKAVERVGEGNVLDSPRAVRAATDVVFLCLTGISAAEETLFAEETGLAGGRGASVVVDTSTVGPEFAITVNARLDERSIVYIECPVSGGPGGAKKGTLSAVLSGDEDCAKRLEPVVAEFASTIHYTGQTGTAQMIKVLNNQAEGINMMGAVEVIALGVKAGMDLGVMREVLSTLRGYSVYMDVLFERLINPSDETSTSLDVRVKDMGLATSLARRDGVPAALSELSERLYGETFLRVVFEVGAAVDREEVVGDVDLAGFQWDVEAERVVVDAAVHGVEGACDVIGHVQAFHAVAFLDVGPEIVAPQLPVLVQEDRLLEALLAPGAEVSPAVPAEGAVQAFEVVGVLGEKPVVDGVGADDLRDSPSDGRTQAVEGEVADRCGHFRPVGVVVAAEAGIAVAAALVLTVVQAAVLDFLDHVAFAVLSDQRPQLAR
jgi:3-hydroxyisobutyrate dehydrogenase-like beta-hydroxyacid dehydrogenase